MNQKRPLRFKQSGILGIYGIGDGFYLPRLFSLLFLLGCMLFVAACRQQQTEQLFIPAVKIDEPKATATPALSDSATAVAQPIAAATTEIFIPALKSDAESDMTGANADVRFVTAKTSDGSTWTFSVTVAHPDTGWEDYADGWDVVLPDGSVLKPAPDSPFTRLLTHPHETEQPFTRSQGGIVIPVEITSVTVRAHDLVDGFGGKVVVVDLTAVSGEDFTVER